MNCHVSKLWTIVGFALVYRETVLRVVSVSDFVGIAHMLTHK